MADNRKSILFRAYIVYFAVFLFAIAIIARIVQIQFVEGDYWKQMATNNTRIVTIEPIRGNIFAEDKSLLATSIPIYDVGMDVDPKVVPDSIFYNNAKLDSLAYCISKMFTVPQTAEKIKIEKLKYKERIKKVRANFIKDSVRYVLIKRGVNYNQLKEMKRFPIFRLGERRGGLVYEQKEKRVFPYVNLAARTIGYEKEARYRVTLNFKYSKIPKGYFDDNIDSLSMCLTNLFHDKKVKDYKEKFVDAYQKKQNVYVFDKFINDNQLNDLKELPIFELKEKGGMRIDTLEHPYYVGLEGAYSKFLRGESGKMLMKKIGSGTWKAVTDVNLIEPKNGCDIYSTIDVNLQDVAESALRKCLDSNNATWGTAVLMEVKTGYIKAITNLNLDRNGNYTENYNFAIGELIEPGSIFKLASVIAALESGEADTSTLVNTGKRKIGNRKEPIVDSHEEGYGRISLAKAFEKSSNVGIAEICYHIFHSNPARFKNYLDKMGMTKMLGLELEGEKPPKVKIDISDLETIPFGYVVKYTPLQILSLYNAVANNGVMVRPRFVKEIRQMGVLKQSFPPFIINKSICSKSTNDKVRKLLEGVVLRGTAKNISKAPYKIAGKTGTAKVYEGGKYIDRYTASFVGYFPADKPKYSCIVIIFKPTGGEYYGSLIAAPVFKEIADKVFATRLEIPQQDIITTVVDAPPIAKLGNQKDLIEVYKVLNFNVISGDFSSEWVKSDLVSKSVKFTNSVFSQLYVPNLLGMGAKDAVYFLDSCGFKVLVNGVGKVIDQSPKPGEPIPADKKIKLYFSITNSYQAPVIAKVEDKEPTVKAPVKDKPAVDNKSKKPVVVKKPDVKKNTPDKKTKPDAKAKPKETNKKPDNKKPKKP
jgi:cell division protein FtsI (penicillin-binding protein 3)